MKLRDGNAALSAAGAAATFFVGALSGKIELVGWRGWAALGALSLIPAVVVFATSTKRNERIARREALTALLVQAYSELRLDPKDKARLMIYVPNEKQTKVWQVARYTGERDVKPKRYRWAYGVGIAGTTMAGTREYIIPDVGANGGMREALKAWGLGDKDFERLRDKNRHSYVSISVYAEGETCGRAVILLDSVRPGAFGEQHTKTLLRYRDSIYWVIQRGVQDGET